LPGVQILRVQSGRRSPIRGPSPSAICPGGLWSRLPKPKLHLPLACSSFLRWPFAQFALAQDRRTATKAVHACRVIGARRITPSVRVQAREGARKNRSEEHTSELQSRGQLVCRLL